MLQLLHRVSELRNDFSFVLFMKTPQQPDPTEEIATGPLISFLSEIMD
jgi:hypothetical protein